MENKRRGYTAFFSWNLMLVVFSFSLMPVFNAEAEGLKAFSVETVDPDYLQLVATKLDKDLNCCDVKFSDNAPVNAANSKPAYRLETLFSSQQGSWMFQSFVNNGLFKVASRYQPHHPKALMITEGVADLEWLYRTVSNDSIIAKVGDGFRLSYPLIIGENAGLTIKGSLELNADSGTALINLGVLTINNAAVMSSVSDSPGFRPFITAWNGSETYIYHSELTGLGYDAYLSNGVSVIQRSDISGNPNRSTWIEVIDSRVVGLESGLMLTGARGVIRGNDIVDSRQYGINASNSSLLIEKNSIKKTAHNSGVHLQNPNGTTVKKNKLENNEKAGISVSGRIGQLKLVGNQLLSNSGHGLLIESIEGSLNGYIQIRGNIIAHNQASGIRINCANICQLDKNLFIANQQYAISFGNSRQFPGHSLLITENSFAQNSNELVQAFELNHLIFGHNKLSLNTGMHSVFAGELQSIQSDILRSALSHNEVVEIKAKH